MQHQDLNVVRHEQKYFLGQGDTLVLRSVLEKVLQRDRNDRRGTGYWIRSLYFDSAHDGDFRDKMSGLEFRKKIRLRIYSPDDRTVKLELKRKMNSFIHKDTLTIGRRDAIDLVRGDRDVLLKYPQPLLRYLHVVMTDEHYAPVSVIDYHREAFVLDIGTVRITFDTDIRAGYTDFDLFRPNLDLVPVFDGRVTVLEVKFTSMIPPWLRKILGSLKAVNSSVSKYCLAREYEFF
jgi:hypothetical protein